MTLDNTNDVTDLLASSFGTPGMLLDEDELGAKFFDLNTREPLNNSMHALSSRRVHYRGAMSPACVDLSRQRNEESGLVWRTLRARPVARRAVVVALAKGHIHYLQLSLATTPDRLAQSTHRVIQRFPRLAGELFQKFMNYNTRLAVVVKDRTRYSKRFQELAWEHDRHGSIRFFPDHASAAAWLEQPK